MSEEDIEDEEIHIPVSDDSSMSEDGVRLISRAWKSRRRREFLAVRLFLYHRAAPAE